MSENPIDTNRARRVAQALEDQGFAGTANDLRARVSELEERRASAWWINLSPMCAALVALDLELQRVHRELPPPCCAAADLEERLRELARLRLDTLEELGLMEPPVLGFLETGDYEVFTNETTRYRCRVLPGGGADPYFEPLDGWPT